MFQTCQGVLSSMISSSNCMPKMSCKLQLLENRGNMNYWMNEHLFVNLLFALTSFRFCYKGECPKADPLFQESLRELASSLPFPYQPNSKLVCYITKELMDAENPPMALPNGLVYSNKVSIVSCVLPYMEIFCAKASCFLVLTMALHFLCCGRLSRKWPVGIMVELLVQGLVWYVTTLILLRCMSHRCFNNCVK